MWHYASEMGADIPYNDFSESAIEARRIDAERNAKLSREITESFKYIGKRWWKKEIDDLSRL